MAIQKELSKNENGKYYYISIDDEERGFGHLIYKNEKFRISEIDMINLIRILLVERRNVTLGRKILDVYNDSTGYSEQTLEKLKQIGLEYKQENEPRKSGRDRTI
jgi:hypothetical protein